MVKQKQKKIKKIDNKQKIIKREKQKLHQKIGVEQKTMQIIYALFLVFFTILFLASSFSYAGKFGNWLYETLTEYFGIAYYVFPLIFALSSYILFKNLQKDFGKTKIISSILFFLASLGLIQVVSEKAGYFGEKISFIQEYIGPFMTGLFFFIVILVSLVIMFDGIPVIKRKSQEFSDYLTDDEEEKLEKIEHDLEKKAILNTKQEVEKEDEKKDVKVFGFLNKDKKEKVENKKDEKSDDDKSFVDNIKNKLKNISEKDVVLPPLSLVSKDKGKPDAGDIKENANIIKNTLASFGISVEIDSVSVGPTVTRYAVKPAQGVKLSKISSLHDNLALALASPSVVIQAPIPGKSLVGIDIPNRKALMVGAGSLFNTEEFKNSKYDLPLALGKNIEGKPEIMSLEDAPHILVAGQTGAGKSVTVHAMIISLLYKHGPDSLKFILVDPKKVEFPVYNGIPHLITPVIKEVKKVILSLQWAINEMERRYSVLEEKGLRNIKNYHEKVYKKALEKGLPEDKMPERMPYIVIVLDELADIMQKYPKELEAGIASLAQKARAVGIHLIISTQRPTVNVVTGLIKANVPARVALSVASAMESRTILDEAGAEKLLGKGDMLYKDGKMIKAKRVQSAFVSEDEVKKVVSFIKKQYKERLDTDEIDFTNDRDLRAEETYDEAGNKISNEEYNQDLLSQSQEINKSKNNDIVIAFDELEADFDLDDKYFDALEEVVLSGKASTSYLQRRIGVGYSRAAKLIDILEEKGVIGPANGSKPREVFWTKEDLEKFNESRKA